LGLLGGLVYMGLLSGAGKQVFAGPEQNVPGTTGMLATLSAQAREVATEGARFASDVRLLYQVSNLAPAARQNAAFAEPEDPKETSCKLISSKGSTANLRNAVKSRS
jgi:hypothetical protein